MINTLIHFFWFSKKPSLWHEGPSAKKMKLDESPAPRPDGNKKNAANPGTDGSTQPRPGPNSIM